MASKSTMALFLALLIMFSLAAPMASFASEGSDATSPASGGSTAAGATSDASSSTAPAVQVSGDHTTALQEGAAFGISDFVRRNKGTNKEYSGSYYGYRYAMVDADAFIAVVTSDGVIVHIPQDTCDTLSIDIDDATFQSSFEATLQAIDADASNGGLKIKSQNLGFIFTSDTTYTAGDYTYAFGVEVEEGHYYATVTLEGSQDGSGGALYAETGHVTAAKDTVVVANPTGWAWLTDFFSDLDWNPLWVSLRTCGVAILIVFVLGILAAWLTIKVSDRAKGLLDTIFTIPMVLPPTVCGFLLLLLFGTSTGIGRWFIAHGVNIVFTWPAAVIACTVVAFPLLYRTARGAFENLDPTMLDAARTLGWSEWRVFVRLMLPLAWPSIAAGTVLAFARAMGEFGATLFFAGNFVGITQTIPIAIYFDWMAGKTDVAIFWVIVVILLSFLVILFINIYTSHSQRYRMRGIVGSGKADEE